MNKTEMIEQTCHMTTFHWGFLWVASNNLGILETRYVTTRNLRSSNGASICKCQQYFFKYGTLKKYLYMHKLCPAHCQPASVCLLTDWDQTLQRALLAAQQVKCSRLFMHFGKCFAYVTDHEAGSSRESDKRLICFS